VTTETSILLPSAAVDLFIQDKKTAEAARNLSQDWRFARVEINVHEGNVEQALELYQANASPDLMIVETETTDESFIGRLEALSGYCDEKTNAVVIGPVNDVNLYRSLTSMGVSDYLVRPVPEETLSEVIAKILIEKLGASGSRLIAVAGAKGGVGVSSLTQVLAYGLSENLGQKTFLMDAAGGWSSLSVGMGFDPAATMQEAVRAANNRDEDTLKRMLFKANDKLSVLATGADSLLDPVVSADQYEELLDMIMATYPVVLVDLSSSDPSLKKTVINRAHELIVVTMPTLTSLRSARSFLQEIKTLRGNDQSNIDLILNKKGIGGNKDVPEKDIAEALDITPSAVIPFDPKLFIGCENGGVKISEDKAGADVVETMLPLAGKVVSASAEKEQVDGSESKSGVLGQLLGKLKK